MDNIMTLARRVTEFWEHVIRRGPDECWPWDGSFDKDGYGQFFFDGRMVGAHTLALSFTTGERKLKELDTCHSCNNRWCVNPAHLRFDTRTSNVADARAAGTLGKDQKLTAADVMTIRRRLAAGALQKHLAEEYGVNNSYISMIKTGKRRA